MIVTWTTLCARAPAATVPWEPSAATWWQAGPCGPGRPEPPRPDGRWWSVLATWSDVEQAQRGPAPGDDLAAWHVVLDVASFRGDVVLAGGAQPFHTAPDGGSTRGAAALLTFAQLGNDSAREREFFRRFMHLGRSVVQAAGHVASMVQAPDDGAVVTFSVWEQAGSALDWAYAQPQHAAAVERQRTHRLLEASGFLRCAVLSSGGSLGERPDPLAGLTGEVVCSGPEPPR